MENIKQDLIELMADFLDSAAVLTEQAVTETKDPVEREKSELHIRMAEAAFREYRKTIVSC